MQRTVSAQAARQRLGELLEGVYYRGDEVVIERAGKPMGVVIPVERYARIAADREQARDRFLAGIDELRSDRTGEDLTDDEAMRIALEEIHAARGERRAEGPTTTRDGG